MYFRVKDLAAAAAYYDENGFVVLTDVSPTLVAAFGAVLSELTGLTVEEIERAGSDGGITISRETRARLARPPMSPELRQLALSAFAEILVRILGPLVHVSQSYHPQIKSGAGPGYILSGYSGDGLEVEAFYGLHQDFTAARVLTSPSAAVFWIPLNNCEDNGLRLYPRTCRCGLVANRWLPPTVQGLERFGPPVEIRAEKGQVLIFNFLVLHGTSNPGPRTRISCDLRFFPFCGILDSVPTVMRPQPVQWIRRRLNEIEGDLLAAPLYEALAYLAQPIEWPRIESHSILHWARFIEGLVMGNDDQMTASVEGLANTENGYDEVESYAKRFSTTALQAQPYESILPSLDPTERLWCREALRRRGIGAIGRG